MLLAGLQLKLLLAEMPVIVEGATVVVFVAVIVLGLLLVELLVELQQEMLVQKGICGNCGTGFCGNKKPKGLAHLLNQSVAGDDPWLFVLIPAALELKEGKS